MNETPFTAEQLITALDQLIGEGEWTLMPRYSGRAMYGATCFGVAHGGRSSAVVALAMCLAAAEHFSAQDLDTEEAVHLVSEIIDDERSDSYGHDTIHYFDGWRLPDDEALSSHVRSFDDDEPEDDDDDEA